MRYADANEAALGDVVLIAGNSALLTGAYSSPLPAQRSRQNANVRLLNGVMRHNATRWLALAVWETAHA